MSTTDVLIIYLALGAPVAMFRFFQSERPFRLLGLANVLAAFAMWPFYAIAQIARSPRTSQDASIFVTRKELDVRIIDDVEYLKEQILSAFAGDDGQVVSLRSEALERYVGLSLADTDSSLSVGKEFFSVAGHPDVMVAVRCHARRNLKRLQRHREDSATDVIRAFSDPTAYIDQQGETLQKLAAIADLIGDTETAARVHQFFAVRSTVNLSEKFYGLRSEERHSSSQKEPSKRAA